MEARDCRDCGWYNHAIKKCLMGITEPESPCDDWETNDHYVDEEDDDEE